MIFKVSLSMLYQFWRWKLFLCLCVTFSSNGTQEHRNGITVVIISLQLNNPFMNNGSFCIMVF